ncbi:hypothetical protein BKA69DRAFT_1085590 [Paraphysoderma sedebokerense]|nr:hypothetical protein BKA69DRAFT_1085590 [Paraphysoderma sedebokerense]
MFIRHYSIRNAKVLNSSAPTALTNSSYSFITTQIRNASNHPKYNLNISQPVGRAVPCQANPNMGYRTLNSILKKNNIRNQVRDNLHFEKPCEKRKRLQRERSERIFKNLVSERVKIAKKMMELGY